MIWERMPEEIPGAGVSASIYDDVPYESRAIAETHPDSLGSVAALHGLAFAPADSCRVLELGCADAGNLLAMASALPGSEFVGIDGNEGQIRGGERRRAAAQISNARLVAADFAAVSDDLGEFDYVVSHGVYSWIAPDAATSLLALIRRRLAPGGIAYVSFNTFPGWHFRQVARDVMRFHIRSVVDPAEQIAQARAVIGMFARLASEEGGTYRARFDQLARGLADEPDYYVFHDYLEPDNHAVYLTEFARRAEAAGLRYVDSNRSAWEAFPPREVEEALASVRTPLVREQYLDLLSNRTFRRAVLCRSDEAIVDEPSQEADSVRNLFISARARSASAEPDIASPAQEEFVASGSSKIQTSSPLIKAALVVLEGRAPRALDFAEVWHEARRLAGDAGADASDDELAQFLVRAFAAGIVRLSPRPSPCAWPLPAQPRATAFAQLQARDGSDVTTLFHRKAELGDLDRFLLARCDGVADATALVDAVLDAVARGVLSPGNGVSADDGPDAIRAAASEAVGASLARLARLGLFRTS